MGTGILCRDTSLPVPICVAAGFESIHYCDIIEIQLKLYYGIGKFILMNSRKGFWGKGATDTISERPQKELPGLY